MTRWLPIETALRDGTDVLLLQNGKAWVGSYNVRETYRNGKLDYRHEGWTSPFLGFVDVKPTHWAMLPEEIAAEQVSA